MTKIFGIGFSGLVGSRISEVLQDKYIIDNLSPSTGVDITNPATLDIIRKDKEHEIVIHLAAKANVDGCEQDKGLGQNGDAYKINVTGTENVVHACKESGKKIIYVSTDFVFDGESPPDGGYTEEDKPNPVNWYAKTKYKGEEVIINSGLQYLIVRLAYPYQQKEFEEKKDFLHAIMNRLKNKQQINAVTDHIMTPTFIDDFAMCIDALIKHNAAGIYHTVGSQSLSPYDAALLISEKFGYDKSLIQKTTRSEYFKGKAQRPFNLTMNNDKIERLGVKMRGFEEGLSELRA